MSAASTLRLVIFAYTHSIASGRSRSIIISMVYIPPIAGAQAQATRKTKRKEGSSSSGFSGYITEAEDSAVQEKPIGSNNGIAASNPLLGIQEISDDSFARKQDIRKGHASLDMLEEIRLALMCGGIPLSMFHEIEGVLKQQRSQTLTPELTDILDEIEVRLAVEHAKLEMALHNSGT